MDQLLIKNAADQTIRAYPLSSEPLVVGRQSYCDIVLNNASVSREHAKVYKTRDGWVIEDLQSRNGVWVNSKKLGDEPVVLSDQDAIQIGSIKMVFASDFQRSEQKSKDCQSEQDSNTLAWKDDDFDLKKIKSQVPFDVSASSSYLTNSNRSREYRSAREYEREIATLENRLLAMLDLARNMGKAEDLIDLAPRFLNDLLRIFPQSDSVCVLVPTGEESDANKVVWRLLNYARRDEKRAEPFRVSRAIIRHVVSTRTAVLSDSAFDDLRFDASESIVTSRIHSVMAAPIYDVANDKLIGIIQVDSRETRRSFERDDLKLLVALANQVAVYWENQRYRDSLLKEKLASQEMQVANQVQRGFLPTEPPKVESYEFFDYYKPAKFVGGDYFDYIPLADGSLAIILADVSGKGISASLLMAKLSAEARFGLAFEQNRADAMTRLNRAFSENHWGGRFITLALVILEPLTGVVHIFNAGHLYPLLSKVDGTVERLGEGFNSFPLGIVPEAEYPEFVYHLQEGEAISLMSDGFPDAMSPTGSSEKEMPEAFGDARVMDELRNPDGLDAERLGRRLIAAMRKFADSAHQTDDQCLVVFRRRPVSASKNDLSTDSVFDKTTVGEPPREPEVPSAVKDDENSRIEIEIK